MTSTLHLHRLEDDRAGQPNIQPNYLQLQHRITVLIDCYLSLEHLSDRLTDLPLQFAHPQTRPWKPIPWQAIDRSQIIGIQPGVFLEILQGAIDTEAPIRGYTQTSRRYLEHLHPQLACFVGGTLTPDGSLLEPGLWEKEERQHTPALVKLYTHLSGEKINPNPHVFRPYQPSDNPYADLYRHGLHRVATEYGATCLYLWLMAHTTGPLQAVLEELTLDEINHMTKFWGFGVWAYPDTSLLKVCQTLLQTMNGRIRYRRDRSSLIGTLHRMINVLSWHSWSWTNRATFLYTCFHTLSRLNHWHHSLTREYLETLFGKQGSRGAGKREG
jgi:hypothetical protein